MKASKYLFPVRATHKWFGFALAMFVLFAIFTAIFASGVLLYPTLQVEQWLLHRPLTSIDCVFEEWKFAGEVQVSLLLILILGFVCLLLGYRRRVLLLLVLLLLIGAGIEVVGKYAFYQPIPFDMHYGLNALVCPQLHKKPESVKLLVGLGLWWEAPAAHPKRITAEQLAANSPINLNEDAYASSGYPSGHAMRWSFLGIIVCWLCWRHIKRRSLRILLMAIALTIAFVGGFAMFYIGGHLITDTIAGYIFGIGLACCAIGLLILNGPKKAIQGPQTSDNTIAEGDNYVTLSDGR
jgi:membrane-associated phospholipid phosphatase